MLPHGRCKELQMQASLVFNGVKGLYIAEGKIRRFETNLSRSIRWRESSAWQPRAILFIDYFQPDRHYHGANYYAMRKVASICPSRLESFTTSNSSSIYPTYSYVIVLYLTPLHPNPSLPASSPHGVIVGHGNHTHKKGI